MSTKTTFKRIALVAVAALGLGVVTSVAPASATGLTITSISAGTPNAARVGVATNTTVTLAAAAIAAGESFTVVARVISAPTGSGFASIPGTSFLPASSAAVAGNTVAPTITLAPVATGSTAVSGSETVADAASTDKLNVFAEYTAAAGADVTNDKVRYTVGITPDVAGTYTVLISSSTRSAAGTAAYAAGDASTTFTFTTAGTPTSVAIASVAGSIVGKGTYGKIVKVSLKDAAGNATVLGANEALTISDNVTSTITGAFSGTTLTTLSSANSADMIGNDYYVRLADSAAVATAETGLLTVTGSGLLPATLTTNLALTTVKATDQTATAITAGADETCLVAHATVATVVTAAFGTNCSSTTFKISVAGGATAFNEAVNVTLPSGLTYSTYYTVPAEASTDAADAITSVELAVGGVAITDTVRLTVAVGAAFAYSTTVSYVAAQATTASIVSPNTTIVSATGATNAITVGLVDQYGEALQYAAVSVSVSGRNTVASKNLGVTDANGHLTYSHTDAGTTGTSDVVAFVAGGKDASRTITYGAVTVGTITITGGSTTASVANATVTTHAIEADDTPESAVQTGTVTVKDANGSLLAGVPVTFTVDKDGAAILSTTKTVYTGSAGTAATSVYAWKAGTYVVTATAGGKSTTASYTFANSRVADARVLSAVAEGGIVTATVSDRFGNPVSGVTVYASKTGTGYFGSGVSKTSTTTGTDGKAEFSVVGNAEVKVSTLSYDAVAGTNAPGQTCATAGNLTCAVGTTAATAFTATTAGTATVAEENVGSSFAPAGVSTVSVSVSNDSASAAADAAAEATDAANAATDAANAAAEAADAATAAAQDAADAVAALSTQVTEMVSALKKQITALTNLVIKIQKKVKA